MSTQGNKSVFIRRYSDEELAVIRANNKLEYFYKPFPSDVKEEKFTKTLCDRLQPFSCRGYSIYYYIDTESSYKLLPDFVNNFVKFYIPGEDRLALWVNDGDYSLYIFTDRTSTASKRLNLAGHEHFITDILKYFYYSRVVYDEYGGLVLNM